MSIDSFLFVIKRAVSNIFKNIVLSLASVSLLVACLVIFGTTLMLSENVSYFIENIGSEARVVVYLDEDLTEEEIANYGKELNKIDNIVKTESEDRKGIEFESREQALENYKSQFGSEEDEINSRLTADIFRNSYIFEVENLSKFEQTVYEVEKIPGGAEISQKHDLVAKLNKIKNVLTFLFSCIMIFLFLISVFVITNSVKASVYARKDEIAIMKYVGATDFFIRLPFFIEGLLIGLFSGLLANVILVYVYSSLIAPILSEIDFITTVDITVGHAYLIPLFLICGGLVGVLGSVLPVRKYLKV